MWTHPSKALLMVVCTLFAFPATAETGYIIDRIKVGVHAEDNLDSPIIKLLATGAQFEVLQRGVDMSQIKEPDGTVGWINTAYMTSNNTEQTLTPPANNQELELLKQKLQVAEQEINKLREQLKAASTSPENTELTTLRLKVGELQAKLTEERISAPKMDQQELELYIQDVESKNADLQRQIIELKNNPDAGKTLTAASSTQRMLSLALFVLGLIIGIFLYDLYKTPATWRISYLIRPMFKIASWNVNSLKVRLPQVLDWLHQYPVDVLGLQELKMTNDQFPLEEINAAGYEAAFNGQKTYNGVALLSRTPATNLLVDLPDFDDPQKRVIGAEYNGVFVLNLYVPNGSDLESDKYQYKLAWLDHLQNLVKDLLKNYPQLCIVGDFNIAPKDEDVHDPEQWQGKVLVSPAEREHFFQLLDQGLHDSFRLFEQSEKSFTWWDYRAAGFRRNLGLRIDHVLISEQLKQSCQRCHIDVSPRTWERPSDHTPIVAEFDL